MRAWLVVVGVLVATAGTAHAGPCRDDSWQPTYVHDLTNPDGPYYVMPDGSFVAVAPPYEVNGPAMCRKYGVRDRRGFAGCRSYTNVQCGCDGASTGNRTCAAFLASRATSAPPPPPSGAREVQRINQDEQRDGTGRITQEAATIHVIECSDRRQFYVYEYLRRAGFRVIQPPDWGRAIGGRDFGGYQEAVGVACGSAAAPVGSGSQTLEVTNERAEKVRTSFATVKGATYVIEASGVFSDWGDKMDGVDPVWCYAEWRCGPNGEVWQQLRIDGRGMSEHIGQPIPYNPSHRYTIEIKGTGQPFELYLSDAQGSAGDNHGKVTVTVRAK